MAWHKYANMQAACSQGTQIVLPSNKQMISPPGGISSSMEVAQVQVKCPLVIVETD